MNWRGWNDGIGCNAVSGTATDGGRVVSMTKRIAPSPLPPELAQLEAYWLALRGAGSDIPARADFSPRGVSDLLHATMLLERIAPGIVRIRLAGTALADLLGMELRGMPLSALFAPDSRDGLSAHLEQVFDAPGILRLQLDGEKGLLRPQLGGEFLALPMRGHDGAVSRALACLVTEGRIGRAPRRFMIRNAALRVVPDYAPEALQPPATRRAERTADAPAPEAGMSEAPAPFAAAPAKTRARFRLIDGGLR